MFTDMQFVLKDRDPKKPYPRGSLATTLLSDIHREFSSSVEPKRPETVFPAEPKLAAEINTKDDPVSIDELF